MIPRFLPENERREVDVRGVVCGRHLPSLHVDVEEHLHYVPVLLVYLRNKFVELLVNHL